ncbi:MAG: hypothetical protein J6M27_05485 [Lachnospiraceae bacterium]|nr:hypothetical protein [Lachnospiraceae bacterium]
MWYVIQTRTGYEKELVEQLESHCENFSRENSLVPMYEDVKRSEGQSRISYRRLLPGYVLVDTEQPESIHQGLKKVGEFARMLLAEEDREKLFLPVSPEDMAFLDSILDDGLMRVSYVQNVKGMKIGKIIGPLAKYGNHISNIDFRHRRAVVDAEIFGKMRRIKFGLWTDEDPKLPWIEERLGIAGVNEYLLKDADVGVQPGDKVKDISGVYSGMEFLVDSVNIGRRTFKTRMDLFGKMTTVELYLDGVEPVG